VGVGEDRGWALGIASVLLLTACAPETTPLFQEDLTRLRNDFVRIEQAIQRSQAEVKADLQRADRQTSQTLTEIQRSLAQIGVRLDEMGRESGQIQGRLDGLRRRLDTLTLQLDAAGVPPRSESARGGPPPGQPPPAPGEAGSRSASPAAPGPVATGGSPAEELYKTAYIDYTRGNFHLAVAAFREFIRRHPGTPLAEAAQYWIGESHFSLARNHQTRGESERATQEFERAAQEFRRVVIEYPQGERVPSALYKRALALLELRQPALAEAELRVLIDQFPSHEEAVKAKEELARLRRR
jgi:TolA-binding protein